MISFALTSIPNQKFQVIVDGHNFIFHFHTIYNNDDFIMLADIYIDGNLEVVGQLCVNKKKLIPYNFICKKYNIGNFYLFNRIDNEYPSYKTLGESTQFIYFTNEEIESGIEWETIM